MYLALKQELLSNVLDEISIFCTKALIIIIITISNITSKYRRIPPSHTYYNSFFAETPSSMFRHLKSNVQSLQICSEYPEGNFVRVHL